MDTFTENFFQTSRSLTYTYYIAPTTSSASNPKRPLLLLHGWPDSAHLWPTTVPALLKTSHPLIIPDLLGYAGTSKLGDPAFYSLRSMATDLSELLTHESIDKYIPIGQVWGAYLAGRFWLWAPERVCSLVLLNVPYTPPAQQAFELQAAIAHQEKTTGNPLWAYWEFFTADGAAEVADAHLESFWGAIHGENSEGKNWMREMFCVSGAIKEDLLGDKQVSLKPYAQEAGLTPDLTVKVGESGHWCTFEAPDEVGKAVAGWLEERS